MITIRSIFGRILGVSLALALVAAAALPVLADHAPEGGGAAVETEHERGRCAPGHDHGLCALAGALRAFLPATSVALPGTRPVDERSTSSGHVSTDHDPTPQVRSRAPPTG